MRQLKCSPSNRVVRDYPIFVGTHIVEEKLLKLVESYGPDQVFIISDTNVAPLYGQFIIDLLKPHFEATLITMPAGETSKTPQTYLDLCDQLLSAAPTKKSFVLLLGGGVVGNVGGFVASTIMRGIRFAHIPTTVIGQADSTTGGKQGVNTKHGKNLLGVFNDPEFVLVDTQFLKTLSAREIRGGIAECIKHALCGDQDFVDYLDQNLQPDAKYSHEVLCEIIFKTLEAKLHVLRYDPKEINEGKVLVYGHTVGHVIETLGNYELTHGEAISIGMMYVAYASLEAGIAGQDLVDIHRRLLEKAGLPITMPEYVTQEKLLEQLKYDKKYSTHMEFVLLSAIGALYAEDGRYGYAIDEEFVSKIYQKYFKQ